MAANPRAAPSRASDRPAAVMPQTSVERRPTWSADQPPTSCDRAAPSPYATRTMPTRLGEKPRWLVRYKTANGSTNVPARLSSVPDQSTQ